MTFTRVLIALVLGSCRSGDPSVHGARTSETREQPEAHPDWEVIPIDVPVFDRVDPGRGRLGSVALSVRAPRGTGMHADTVALQLPNSHVVVMTPDESWPGGARSIAERTFVTADCTRRRVVDWGQPLAPWDGRVVERVRSAAGDAVTICRGPGDPELREPRDCYLVSSYLVSAKLECGAGPACLEEAQATTVAAICASVRRR